MTHNNSELDEVWKDIPGYEGYYKASNLGRISSTPRMTKGRWGLRPSNGGVMKPYKNTAYQEVGLSVDGKIKTMKVHRLVILAFIPNPDNKPFINHKDANKHNNRADNLEWCTREENANHARRLDLFHTKENGKHYKTHQTHCPQNHPYAGENLYFDKHGRRNCKTCMWKLDRARDFERTFIPKADLVEYLNGLRKVVKRDYDGSYLDDKAVAKEGLLDEIIKYIKETTE